jgi:hypothetical protein
MNIEFALIAVSRIYLDSAPVIYYVQGVAPFFPVVDRVFQQIEVGVLTALTSPVVSARGTVVRFALVGFPMAMNQSCYEIQGKKGYTDLFIYYFIRLPIAALQRQTHGTVFETRDALLPKLLSGEICVKDAEKAVETVA